MLGRVVIDLRFVVNRSETNILILPLEGPTEGLTVEVTIQGEILDGDVEENDETMSLGSDSSSGTLASVLGLNTSLGNASGLSSPFGTGSTAQEQATKLTTGSSFNGPPIEADDSFDDIAALNVSNGSLFQEPCDSSSGTSLSQREYIGQLEMKLLRLQQLHLDEKKRMKEQFETYRASSSKAIQDLNKELMQLKDKRYICAPEII